MKHKNYFPTNYLIVTILFFAFAVIGCNKKTIKNNSNSKNENDSLIINAELFAQLHNDGLEFVLDYPGQDSINLYQKVMLSKSFCLINEVDTSALNFTPQDIESFYSSYDTDNLKNLTSQLLNNNLIDDSTQIYLDQAIDISEESSTFDQKIAELSELQITISNDSIISDTSKIKSLYAVTTMKQSAIFWNGVQKSKINKNSKSTDCADCIKNNIWKIAGMDGIGVIFSIFAGPFAPIVSVATAVSLSITSVCRYCNLCSGCGGDSPWYPYSCNNCPSPSKFDGANCFYGRPKSGIVFIMNGNMYWDDPTHACKLPIWNGEFTQGNWDGAHCYVPIPNGAQAFVYKNGLYIRCN